MIPIDRKDATRRLGAPENWEAGKDGPCGVLAIADVTYASGANAMESLWRPEPEEIAAIAAGQPVTLTIVGHFHPVVAMGVLAEGAEA